jgi:uncharacterized cupredoxin-like copper-binding protein
MTRRALPLLVLFATLALPLAACGGGNGESATTSSGGGGGGSTVKIAADPSGALKFDTTSLEATAGDVKVEGNGVEDEGTDQVTGGSTSATLDLQPGTYTFFCSVDGHRAAGMEGQLVVK